MMRLKTALLLCVCFISLPSNAKVRAIHFKKKSKCEEHGIRDWVENLPEKKIAMSSLANYYTIIGL